MPAKTVVLRHGPNGYPANPSTLDAAGDGPFDGETVLRMDAQANDSAGAWPVDTDAAGMLPCTTGGTALDRSAFSMTCDFRVKRNPYGATIWALRPGDRRDPAALQTTDLRVLYVESDVFSTSDASEVQTQQAEDSWVVSVGERERYWIPLRCHPGRLSRLPLSGSRPMHTAARIVLGLYVLAVVFAFVAWALGDGPLESIFAVLVAAPWAPLLFRLLETLTDGATPPVAVGVAGILAGIAVNLLILYTWVRKSARG